MSAGNNESAPPADGDSLVKLLAEFDAGLKAGSAPAAIDLPVDVPPASQSQLLRAQACLRMLEEVWPRRRAASPQSVLTGGTAAQTSSGGKTLGRFEIRRELGRGGFGVVHLAFDPRLGREVALKVPHAQVFADPELHSRFQREARAAAGLDHPNIVPVYEAGEVDSVGYIALAYCPGINLHDWLRRRIDSISGPAIAEFMATLAGAIHHAHEQGIIHRDLKPANVLLGGEWIDEPGYAHQPPSLAAFAPKITDFGLAKQLDSEMTQTHTGTIAGTPCYMAPEQTGRQGSEIGPATDVYSLGAILYELLTGRAPFQGETVLDTLDQVRNLDPIPPRRLRPGVPRDLEIICLKCLEKDPSRRYASAKLLEEDFRRYLGGRSIVARPTGPLSQVAKWAKRRPAVAALVAVSAIAVAVLVGSDIYIRQKNQETRRALEKELRARGEMTSALSRERQALYYHRIRLTQAAILENVRQAERYLEACLPGPGERDFRGWEWHYLTRLCHSELITFREHHKSISHLALSPDGKQAASVSSDGEGKVWDSATGAVLWTFSGTIGPSPRLRRLAFSPSGQLLAWGSYPENVVRIFDARDGKELHRVGGCQVRFSDDGSQLATIDQPPQQVRVYDAHSGTQLQSHLLPPTFKAVVALLGQRLTVATLQADFAIRVQHFPSGQETILRGQPIEPLVLELSHDGHHVAAGTNDGIVRAWDTEEGRLLFDVRAHVGFVESIEFGPRGEHIATADTLGAIKLWNLQGRQIQSLPGHGYVIGCLAYSGDGRLLASGSGDSTVKIWDTTRDPQGILLRGHRSFAYAIAWSPDGKRLASSGFEPTVKIWNPDSGEVLVNITEQAGYIRRLAFSVDGSELIGCDGSGRVIVWNSTTGQLLRTRPLAGVPNLRHVALGAHGTLAAVQADDQQSVLIRDAATGKTLATLPQTSQVESIAFDAEGRNLAVAAKDFAVRVWEARSGRLLHTLRGHNDALQCLTFSRDGKRLASGGSDRMVRLWDLTSGTEALAIKNQWGRSNLHALAFSPDGKRLAGGKLDATVMLWDAESGQEVLELRCQSVGVTGLAFSPGGERLAAIVNDGSVMVWDAAPQR